MTRELFQLFSEGGGAEALNKSSVVRPESPESDPWLPVAQTLAAVQEESLEQQLAHALIASVAQSNADFRGIRQRAMGFLQSNSDERQEAVRLLLSAAQMLQQRFEITPWEAYWGILVRAFRDQVSPLSLVQSLVRELEQDAA